MTRLVLALLTVFSMMLLTPQVGFAEEEETYTVKKDNALLEVAWENHTTIEDLLTINRIDHHIVLEELPNYELYEVKKGDTLYWLAKDFNTTVDALMEANGLDSSLILIGQKLKVYQHPSEEEVVQAEIPKTKAATQQVEREEEAEQIQGVKMTVTATAYTAECDGCSGITYTGVNLLKNRQAKVIAVDPKVIPLGSKVYVEGYGYARAEDIGSAIKGNRIDIHLPTKKEAYAWGVREVTITLLHD